MYMHIYIFICIYIYRFYNLHVRVTCIHIYIHVYICRWLHCLTHVAWRAHFMYMHTTFHDWCFENVVFVKRMCPLQTKPLQAWRLLISQHIRIIISLVSIYIHICISRHSSVAKHIKYVACTVSYDVLCIMWLRDFFLTSRHPGPQREWRGMVAATFTSGR